jgi:phosphoserine phosphatase
MMAEAEFVVSLLAPESSAEPPSGSADLWSALSARVLRDQVVPAGTVASCACHHYWISAPDDIAKLRALAREFDASYDIAILSVSTSIRPQLIAFDLDSTLINVEVIDELARLAGVGEEVRQLTESAMRGEMNFQQAFRRRIALLKGLDERRCLHLLDGIALNDGAERLIHSLHAIGCKIAVLSGGFSFVVDWLKQRLPIDFALTNTLAVRDGCVTGEVIEPVVDGAAKASAFRELAEVNRIPMKQTIAVGDGANDLPMMKLAGLSVAFRAKPKVREQADVALSRVGLDAILHLIAPPEREGFVAEQ